MDSRPIIMISEGMWKVYVRIRQRGHITTPSIWLPMDNTEAVAVCFIYCKTLPFKILLLFGSILNLLIICVCNFRLQRRPGSFRSHSVIVPSLVHSFQTEVRIHWGTHISVCLLRSTSITLPSPLLLSSSHFLFAPHLYIGVSCHHCVFSPLSSQSLFFLFDWISLSCLPWMSDYLMNEMPFHQDATTAVTQNSICCLVCEIPLWIGALSFPPERLMKDS